MRISRRAAGVSAGIALAVGATGFAAPGAQAAPHKLGTKSLVSVLSADKSGFDRNGKDFDIATAAVVAVLKAKPKSPVSLLANGKVALTAFLPNDLAFQILVSDVAGKRIRNEKTAFDTAVKALGVNTIEQVLLYHVIPGKTITAAQALHSDGARLATALPKKPIRVNVKKAHGKVGVFLVDLDRNDKDPRVNRYDINKGNRQIAHGITYVLRPANLP